MFHAIRRAITALFCGLWVGVGVFAYQHRAIFQPVADWVTVLKNRKNVSPVFQEQVMGAVTKIVDGDTFLMRAESGEYYTISLIGLAAPEIHRNQPQAEKELANRSRQYLSDLILSNNVSANLTFATPRRAGVGLVRLGETNVNAEVAAAGWSEVNRDFIRTLPASDQVAMIQAERKAKNAQRGLWQAPESSAIE